MRIALDTNRYGDLVRGDLEVARLVEYADAVFLPFVVIAELRAGFAGGNKGVENEAALGRFLSTPGVAALYASNSTTHTYARLYIQLRSQGNPIPTNDLWIAALVAEHNLTLLTRDAHFDQLRQLKTL